MPRFSLSKALIATVISIAACVLPARAASKYEFRGAWIQTVFQEQFRRLGPDGTRQWLTDLLDRLHATGINAVIFQVRPSADAFYPSHIEPWSRHLTGSPQGVDPGWDPLQFMIEQCHSRGMELHAWLNPYRVTASANEALPANHFTRTHPERYVTFNRRLYFNPAIAENRAHIVSVVTDIITRYDVDGIHFDDYFYPYPNGAEKFNDAAQYAASGSSMNLSDWRRSNVDSLICDVHTAIAANKPWIRFGISPFGIWRNRCNDPRGSDTSGLQNFDDLYADVPSWAEKGWIDYQIPQLYWELDHKRASYRTLCRWWADNGFGRHVYIGQDVKKTADADELDEKLRLIDAESTDAIQGNCWWYAANLSALTPALKERVYTAPALVPEYLWLPADPAPKPHAPEYSDGKIRWQADPEARKWVVYRFNSPDAIDINDPAAICAVTYSPSHIPSATGYYVITALDRANGESAPSLPVHVASI
ncbi:MAG: family 10 glycosylhydrolase [Muribaculaceae bacterium]|nr:family 10 glycosylhydrolase [Muribaculaceae bacterium]